MGWPSCQRLCACLRLWSVVLCLFAVTGALAACQRATPPAGVIVSGQVLAQYPEYHLYYPGSTPIGRAA